MKRMAEHCADNAGDRKLGEVWERRFCALAAKHGRCFTPHQIGRPSRAAAAGLRRAQEWELLLLPDVTVWTAPGEHHEIKHKSPTRQGDFGLELYRLQSLVRFARETNQDVLYTIHDWSISGDRSDTINLIEHWRTANICDLAGNIDRQLPGSSYRGGRRVDGIPICYWRKDRWLPLAQYWNVAARVAA